MIAPRARTRQGQSVGRIALRRWQFAVYGFFFAAGLFQSTWFARIASLGTELDLDLARLSLLVGAFATGSVAGLILAPLVYRRLGPRRTQAVASILIAVLFVAAGIAADVGKSLELTSAFILLSAVGFGIFDVSMNVSGAAVEGLAHRSLMPSFHGMYSTGALVGAAGTVLLIFLGMSISTQFTVVGVLVLLLVGRLLRMTPRRSPVPPAAAERTTARAKRKSFTDLRLLLVGLTLLCLTIVEGTAVNWVAVVGERSYDLETGTATLSLVAFLLATVATRFVGGSLVDRIGRVWTLRIGACVAAGGIGIYIVANSSILLVLIGAFLWGAGVAVGFPLCVSAAADAGAAAGAAARVSLVSGFGYAASFVGPPIIGLLAGAIGPLGAFASVVGLLLIAFLAAAATPRR